MEKEIHVCCYCGQEAHYQFKNGKWCCSPQMNYCPQIKKIRQIKTQQRWQQLHELGIKNQKDVPQELKALKTDLGTIGVCYYCGRQANYQLKNGRWCCQSSPNRCPININKNKMGVNKAYKNGLEQKKQKSFTEESRYRQGVGRRGKTKFTCQEIKEWGIRLHKRYEKGEIIHSQLGHKHTPQELKKIIGGMYSTHRKSNKKMYGYKRGWYKGYWCDSSWELAFVIYNLQHNIKFERNLQQFQYEYKGKFHRFYPDFILQDGTYVEIKGWFGEKNQAKIASFPNLKLITKKEIQPYLEYTIMRYGKNFYNLYE